MTCLASSRCVTVAAVLAVSYQKVHLCELVYYNLIFNQLLDKYRRSVISQWFNNNAEIVFLAHHVADIRSRAFIVYEWSPLLLTSLSSYWKVPSCKPHWLPLGKVQRLSSDLSYRAGLGVVLLEELVIVKNPLGGSIDRWLVTSSQVGTTSMLWWLIFYLDNMDWA